MKEKIKTQKGFIKSSLLIIITVFLIALIAVTYVILERKHIIIPSSTVAVQEFMKARIERDEKKTLSFLTDNAKTQYLLGENGLSLTGTSNPHFADFIILERQVLNTTQFRFKVRIGEEYTGQGKIGYFDETLTVVKQGYKYLIDSAERGEYTNLVEKVNHGPEPYFNTDYGFILLSDPNQTDSNQDDIKFEVIPIFESCGDIAKSCPPAKVIPTPDYWNDSSIRPPLILTQKITFPDNPVPFCFIKGNPEGGAGSIYDSYYYLTTTKDNRCFAMHFVVHKPNCEMFGIKEQIDKCNQGNERIDQIPNEYVKTFKFVQ